MKPELMLLGWSVILAIVQMLIAVQGAMMQVGLTTLVGNREGFPEIKGWAGRAARAHRNMIENLVLFAALVLALAAAGKSNDATVLGAQIFFWGRVAYAAIYLAGIPWARTGAWTVSVVGLLVLLAQLLG
ncbi:MAG TPA: MAPEG family protein [Burkholderiales bacterium]|nr:MAPEG family protein [Burkholderiales bacterium]